MTQFIVLTTYGKENVLGYIDQRQPTVFGILATSIINGATLSWLDGFSFLSVYPNYRPATLNDFAKFRVSPKGYIEDTKNYHPIPN